VSQPENARTSDPDLKEIVAAMNGLRDFFIEKTAHILKMMDERDIRYEQRFEAMDEKTSLALTSSEKAVTKAETATEKRFDAVNEFRGSLKDQASTLMPRAEAETKFKAYDDRLESMKKDFETKQNDIKTESRGQGNWRTTLILTALLSGAGLIIALLTLVRK
jgi:uncharacterized phage infection (PIP) family protein YhgE